MNKNLQFDREAAYGMRLVRFWRFISFSSYFNSGILKLSHMRLLLLVAKFVRVRLQLTLGARGFLREEPQSAISEAVKREKIDKRRENLWLPTTVD